MADIGTRNRRVGEPTKIRGMSGLIRDVECRDGAGTEWMGPVWEIRISRLG